MDNMPHIRIELRGLGQMIAGQIMVRSNEFESAVAKALDELIANGRLEQLVRLEVEKIIPLAVESALHSYQVHDKLRDIIIMALAPIKGPKHEN